MVKRYIATNDKGYRVGQDHWNAKLTDIEVDALIRDRGPEDAPTMSLSQLAKRYGLSKSGVKGILDGNRRGQAQRLVKKDKPAAKIAQRPEKRVRVDLRVSLRSRAILHRLGGGAWIDRLAVRVDSVLRCARNLDEQQAVERVLKNIGVV